MSGNTAIVGEKTSEQKRAMYLHPFVAACLQRTSIRKYITNTDGTLSLDLLHRSPGFLVIYHALLVNPR